MAYVPVPKDLSRIKTKVAFNLTKRRLIFFAAALLVGLPLFLFTQRQRGDKSCGVRDDPRYAALLSVRHV